MTHTIPQIPPRRAWMAIYSNTVYCRPEIADAVLAAIQRVSPAAYIHIPRPGFVEYPDGSRADTVKIHPCCGSTVLARADVRNCLHDFNQWVLPAGVQVAHTEPDGVQGYEYTLEARYGVAVGEDWLPVAMRRKAAVTLFHPAMLCEAA